MKKLISEFKPLKTIIANYNKNLYLNQLKKPSSFSLILRNNNKEMTKKYSLEEFSLTNKQ